MSFSIWSGNLCHLRNCISTNFSYKLLSPKSKVTCEKLINPRTCKLRLVATNVEGENQKSQDRKFNAKLNLRNVSVRTNGSNGITKSGLHEHKAVLCYDVQNITERKVTDWPVVVIVFDIETTGLSRQKERIIEIALRDLHGGQNSVFQTLVNPGKFVKNAYIHGIRSNMVNRPDVPRFEELIPILLKYIKSRQRDGKQVILVAHNGRRFDVPFLISEFQRCSVEIPQDWLFLDTLYIARQLVNPDGSKLPSVSLDSLRQYYNIDLVGPAHRAMQDVMTLAHVLQKMTFQLKLTVPELLERSFRASDITKSTP